MALKYDHKKYLLGPFKTEEGYIFGPDDTAFAEVRGWGKLQYIQNGKEIQDANAEHIARALNSYFPMLQALKNLVEIQAVRPELLDLQSPVREQLLAAARWAIKQAEE